jgi:ABC-type iron transport system FetAB ATPase subunit
MVYAGVVKVKVSNKAAKVDPGRYISTTSPSGTDKLTFLRKKSGIFSSLY